MANPVPLRPRDEYWRDKVSEHLNAVMTLLDRDEAWAELDQDTRFVTLDFVATAERFHQTLLPNTPYKIPRALRRDDERRGIRRPIGSR